MLLKKKVTFSSVETIVIGMGASVSFELFMFSFEIFLYSNLMNEKKNDKNLSQFSQAKIYF